MKKAINALFLACTLTCAINAQEVVMLNSHLTNNEGAGASTEKITYAENGTVTGISNVTSPSIAVYLPDPAIATGTAVVVLPGGALRFLSWDNEGVRVAEWLNSKGIAAFVLKYRLDNREMKQPGVNPPSMQLRLTIDQFDQLKNANANPSDDPESVIVVNRAAADAREAIRVIRERFGEWKINPYRVGYLGFSAGGGVAINAIVNNENPETMPDFIGTIYGPSLVDVRVPSPAPPLFIATAADHMNVAAGCLALFLTWEKAGAEADLHVYGKGKGAFGMTQQGLPSDEWIQDFYIWLVSQFSDTEP